MYTNLNWHHVFGSIGLVEWSMTASVADVLLPRICQNGPLSEKA